MEDGNVKEEEEEFFSTRPAVAIVGSTVGSTATETAAGSTRSASVAPPKSTWHGVGRNSSVSSCSFSSETESQWTTATGITAASTRHHEEEVMVPAAHDDDHGKTKTVRQEAMELWEAPPRRVVKLLFRSWRNERVFLLKRRRRRRQQQRRQRQDARTAEPGNPMASHKVAAETNPPHESGGTLRDTFRLDWGRLVNGDLFRSVEGFMGLSSGDERKKHEHRGESREEDHGEKDQDDDDAVKGALKDIDEVDNDENDDDKDSPTQEGGKGRETSLVVEKMEALKIQSQQQVEGGDKE